MKSVKFCVLALAGACICICSDLYAQGSVRLSNYTFTSGSKTIGKVILADNENPKVKLAGKSARLFSIDKNHNLVARKAFAINDTARWHNVVIVSGTGKGAATDTVRIVKDEFLLNPIIAHRGAWKHTGATANSVGALQHAIKLGCAGSEFDVHMSADSVLFVFHDHVIQGKPIEKTVAAELTQLKLANGEFLPTLEAYLQEGIKQNKTRLILEIKPSGLGKERSLALAEKVVQLVQKQKAQAWVDYISFDYDILKRVLAQDPYARVAYLGGNVPPTKLAEDKFYGLDYHFSFFLKFPEWVEQAQQLNLTLNYWTVNDPAQMDALLAEDVDFITTDEPEILLEKVNR